MPVKYAVNTKTQAEFDTLMTAFQSKTWKCINGKLPTDYNMWNMTKDKTCVFFNDGFKFANIDWCLANGYTIKTVAQAKAMMK